MTNTGYMIDGGSRFEMVRWRNGGGLGMTSGVTDGRARRHRLVTTNKKVAVLDVEFIEYKAEAKASMDALEKKCDNVQGPDRTESRTELLKYAGPEDRTEMVLYGPGRSSVWSGPTRHNHRVFGRTEPDRTGPGRTGTESNKNPGPRTRPKYVWSGPVSGPVAAKATPYVPPIRRSYDDIGFELPKFHDDPCIAIGKNLRVDFMELEDSNKPKLRKLDDIIDDRIGEREHRGTGTNHAGDIFAYHRFEHRMRKLKMPMFEEQLRATNLSVEVEALSSYRWSEGRTPFNLWDGFKRRLLIRFQLSQEGNMYEQFLAITQEDSARAYVALFERLACQLVGIPETVMEATFIKGLKLALRAAVRVMNPDGLNHAMELAVSVEDNQLYESKGVVR
nr:ankyrin repeat-containing protein [Tanacetum cinerariifolium]